jgi:type IV secretory pathway VirB2 component (pilin)
MNLFTIKSLRVKVKQRLYVIALLSAFLPRMALAAKDLPGVAQLQALQESISGPMLMSISVIMIVVTCITSAMGEWGEGFKTLIKWVIWLSIAGGAAGLIDTLMS